MQEPTATGGGVRHSTESMFAYQSGALPGSPANAATSATGRRITVSVSTSTSPATALTSCPGMIPRRRCVGDLDRHPEHLPHLDPVRVAEPAGRGHLGHRRTSRVGDGADRVAADDLVQL